MIVYVDSGALLKRVLDEAGSIELAGALKSYFAEGDAIVASSLAWVEVSRGLLKVARQTGENVEDVILEATAGIGERPVSAEVIGVARRIGPSQLRSLDAIHLATAVLLNADIVLTYDERLAGACRYNGLKTASPGW